MEVAQETMGKAGSPPPLLFFVGVQPSGAVPQVRRLIGVKGSPRFVIIDIDKEQRYTLRETDVTQASMRAFVESYLRGDLQPEPLGEDDDAAAADGPDEAPRLEPEAADPPAAAQREQEGRGSSCSLS